MKWWGSWLLVIFGSMIINLVWVVVIKYGMSPQTSLSSAIEQRANDIYVDYMAEQRVIKRIEDESR